MASLRQPLPRHPEVATATARREITDETKAVLPGVTVTTLNEQTGQGRTVVTDDRGFYRIPALQPGRYTIAAELSGFATTDAPALR